MGAIGKETDLSPSEDITLPPEVETLRAVLAEYLQTADEAGSDPGIVRIAFDEGQAARALFIAIKELQMRFPDEDPVREPDELLKIAAAAYGQGVAIVRPELLRVRVENQQL